MKFPRRLLNSRNAQLLNCYGSYPFLPETNRGDRFDMSRDRFDIAKRRGFVCDP